MLFTLRKGCGARRWRPLYCGLAALMVIVGASAVEVEAQDPRCFTLWMAGGGVKGGVVYGETDDFSYNIVENPVHIRDLQATILHLFGINHERFTFKHQGLEARLTGVEEPAHVIHPLLA